MWAQIQSGKVIEVTDIDPTGRYHPSLVWTESPSSVSSGWNYSVKLGFTPPVPAAAYLTPQSCSPAQGLVALFALKSITEDNVLTAIGQIPDPVQQYTARIGYQRATVWERGSPTMQAMAQLLQLSEEDLDALFAHAVTVQV